MARPAPAAPGKWAIIVGVGRYDDRSIPGIPFCRRDACDLTTALRAQKYEVICLTDEGEKGTGLVLPAAPGGSTPPAPAGEDAPAPASPDATPTRESILQRVQAFLADERIAEGDLVMVYFSGHGFASGDTAYLATRDADLKRLEETCIPMTWLRDRLGACRARQKVLLLDSCHSGVRPFKGKPVEDKRAELPGQAEVAERIFATATAESAMVVLASCRGSESSWQKGEQSAFTSYVLSGLAQAADGNRDGKVGVTELNNYVHDRVTTWAREVGVKQTPVFHGLDLEGDITLADCPIPKVKSNTLLYVGGGVGVAAVAALAGGGGGGGSTPAPPSSTVSGYVYRTTQRSVLDRFRWPGRTRQSGPCLCILPQSGAPGCFEAASGATVSVTGGSTTTANAEGFFSLSLVEGSYTLTASCNGYASLTFTVACSGGASVQVAAGNPDVVPPVLAAASAQDAAHVDLVFNETLQGASVNLLVNYAITPALAVTGVQLLTDGRTIRLTTADQKKDADYSVTVSNIHDANGNKVGTTGNTATFKGKGQLPRVTSVSTVDSTHVDVLFSEPVQEGAAAAASSYSISPALAVEAARLQDDNKTVRLTTAEQTDGKVYTLTATGILDLAGDAVGTGNWATFPGIGIAPRVLADRVRAIDEKHVEVVFHKAVDATTAAVPGNYRLSPTLAVVAAQPQGDGVTVWLETPEQKGGESYKLTVSGVKDKAGNAVDAAANSGTFPGLCVPPQVSSARAVDNTHVDVLFSEALDAASAQTGTNYTIAPALEVAGVPALVAPGTVRLPTAAQQEGTTYRVTVANVADVAGNAVEKANVALFVGASVSGEVPLQVVSAAASGDTHVDVRFSKALDPTTAAAAGNYAVSGLAVSAAQLLSDNESVRLTTVAQTAGQSYTVTVTGVKDTGGKAIGTTGNTAAFTGGVVALRITGSAAKSSTSVQIDLNKALDTSTAAVSSRYSLSPSLVVVSVEVLAGNASVRLTTAEQTGGTEYTVTVTGVTDADGGALATDGSTTRFNGIGIAPTVVSATAAADGSHVDVLFSEAVKAGGAGTAANYAISSSLAVSAAQLQADGKTVRLTTGDQVGGTEYTVTVSNVTDLAGNPIGTPNSAGFTGVAPPFLLVSAGGADATHVDLLFNRALDASSVAPAGFAISPSLAVSAAEVRQDGVTVRVTTAEHGAGVVYTVTVTGVKDSIGNTIAAPNNTAEFQGLAPRVVSAAVVDSTHVDVVFSAALDKASAETAGSYTLSPALAVVSAALQGDGKTVRLEVAEQTGGVTYTVTVTGVRDTGGHTVSSTNNHAGFTGIGDPPQVVSAVAVDSTTVDVTFSEPVDSATANTAGSYTINPALSVASATRQADAKVVRLVTATQSAGTTYTLTVTGVKDGAGNPIAPPTNTATFTGFDRVTLSAASVSQTGGVSGSNLGDYEYRVTYTHKENAAPSTVRITINKPDGSAMGTWDMAKLDAGDTTYTDGCVYRFKPSIFVGGTGTYAYTFATSDGSATAAPTTGTGPAVTALDPGRIVFESDRDGNSEIYSMSADGTNQARLTNNTGNDQSPVWSPDGSKIAFGSWRDGNSEIYVMDADGTNQTRLTNNTADDYTPAWSPDGSKIAFESNRNGGWEIFVMSADGSGQTSLAPGFTPAWSPDGSKIAFDLRPGGVGGVYTMNADGSGQTLLAYTGGYSGNPAWSPDGNSIVFDSQVGGYAEISVMNADGSGQTLLTSGAAHNSEAVWSPDGKKLAFYSGRDGTSYEMYAMNADGTSQTRLTNNGTNDIRPAWSAGPWAPSPYSASVAASTGSIAANGQATSTLTVTVRDGGYRPFQGATVNFNTTLGTITSSATTDANGQATATLTAGTIPGAATVNASVSGGKSPTASTSVTLMDNSRLILASNRDGHSWMYSMNPDSSGVTRATTSDGIDPWPSPDGSKIVFSSGGELYTADLDGGNLTRLTNNSVDDAGPAWSPDGRRIAWTRREESDWQNTEVWVMNADGSNPTRITNNAAREGGTSWSPDSTRLVYGSEEAGGWGNWDLYLVNADGTGKTRLTSDATSDQDPAWSPDGTKILYQRGADGSRQLYVIGVDGTGRTALTSSSGENVRARWSPDGSRIACSSSRDGNYDIWVMGADGSGATNVTNNTDFNLPVAWGPSPQTPSAYSATLTVTPASTNLAGETTKATLTATVRDGAYRLLEGCTVNFATDLGTLSATSAVTNASGQASVTLTGVTPGPATVTATAVGVKNPVATVTVKLIGQGVISFFSMRDGNYEVYTMRPDGSGQMRLTTDPAADTSPAWSPDGATIAFRSYRDGNSRIYVMNADGTGQTCLTTESDNCPAWSPDGARIAFYSGRDGNNEIYVMNADGTGQTRLTNNSASDWRPAWSPDGAKIAFHSDRDGNWEIYVMDSDGSNPVRVTNSASDDLYPAWSPDGRRLAFHSYRDGNYEIYVMNSDGSDPSRLTHNAANDSVPTWSPDGSAIAFHSNRDGNVEVHCMRSDGTGQVRLTSQEGDDGAPSWSRGTSATGRAVGPARRAAEPRLRARCAGLEADFVLTPDMKSGALGEAPGVLPDAGEAVSVREDGQPAGSEHPISYGVPGGRATEPRTPNAEPPLRFEALTGASASRVTRHVSRTWDFLLHSLPDEETLLTWPDLSGIGAKERVVLEDLDANVRRNMRTSTSYAFRGESRRFRVTAEKRSGAALLITELAVEGAGRGSARVARVTLSAEADLDLDLISPTGALLAEIARAKPLPAGTSRIPWRADLPPGLYLLRARARGADATVVQSVRPVAVVR